MATPEGRVKAAVNKILIGASAYRHCPVMNGMGAPALDYHVCHRGIYAAIETKAPDKWPTPRQTRTMRDVVAAGGALFLIRDDDDVAQLIGWTIHPIPGFISKTAASWLARKNDDDELHG